MPHLFAEHRIAATRLQGGKKWRISDRSARLFGARNDLKSDSVSRLHARFLSFFSRPDLPRLQDGRSGPLFADPGRKAGRHFFPLFEPLVANSNRV